MDAPISNSLKITFLVHMILAVIFGAALFLIPGRTYTFIGAAQKEVTVQTQDGAVIVPGTSFVDPGTTRQLGAAYLAMGFSSFLGWRASRRVQVSLLVQMEFVYCILGVVAILALRFLAPPSVPFSAAIWVMAAILTAFAVAWGLALRR